MIGVIDPTFYYLCDIERSAQLSNRIYARNIPKTVPPMAFSPRPVSTKYDIMPIMDRREECNVPIRPGNACLGNLGDSVSFNWYAERVGDESELRNQLEKKTASGNEQYVPSSTSDLYNYKVMGNQVQHLEKNVNDHSLLFNTPTNLVTTMSCNMPPAPRKFDNPTRPKQSLNCIPATTRSAQQPRHEKQD